MFEQWKNRFLPFMWQHFYNMQQVACCRRNNRCMLCLILRYIFLILIHFFLGKTKKKYVTGIINKILILPFLVPVFCYANVGIISNSTCLICKSLLVMKANTLLSTIKIANFMFNMKDKATILNEIPPRRVYFTRTFEKTSFKHYYLSYILLLVTFTFIG